MPPIPGPSEIKNELRKLNRQHVRKALVAATGPLRALPLPVARPPGRALEENEVVFRTRETGRFTSLPVDFGTAMPERPYDQESVVLRIDGAEGTFRNLLAFDGQRRALYEQQLPFNEFPVSFQRLDPIEQTYENVAFLSNTWVTNFYHWLFFAMPMLRFYEAAGVGLDKLYVGEPLKAWQIETLPFVGLSEDMIVTEPCRAEVAHVAVLTRHTPGISAEEIMWARETFVKTEPPRGHRKLFVGRGEVRTRQMIDEEVIASALEREFGFEYMTTTGLTFNDEIELFGQADSIIAPYGAALTNILFSPVGTKVLELMAYDNDFSVAHCYQELSAVLGHRHGTIRGLPTPRKRRGVDSDIKVPLDQILRETEKMLSAS